MANVLIVDNFTLPTPDKMEYKEADLQWSGWRDAAGFLHKTTVRYGVRTIKVTYERTLYNEDITLIRNALTGPGKEYLTVTYYCDDAQEGGTMTAYVSDRDYALVRVMESNAKWTGLTFTLIER